MATKQSLVGILGILRKTRKDPSVCKLPKEI